MSEKKNSKDKLKTEAIQNIETDYQNTQQILHNQVVQQRALPSLHLPKKDCSLMEANEYQSSGVLMRRLADTITQWRQQLPNDEEPAILAILFGGMQISVEKLAQESFHGIRIEGTMNGSPCMLLAHQSTVQMLCFVKKIEKTQVKRRIGFIIDGEEQEV